MDHLRTPDERFADLPDYPFAPHYATVKVGLRMHYLDEQPTAATTVVCLHGEPSWSYLYRKMIPYLTAAGFRVIAPDLIGFGRSDKPVAEADHSYARHVAWLRELLFEHLGLKNVHLFGQDWGGLLGLRLVGEHPDRFASVVAANTFLPTGEHSPGPAFEQWLALSQKLNPFPCGKILQNVSNTELTAAEMAAYDAPFPDAGYQAGPRVMPRLVPIRPEDPATEANKAAWAVLRRWEKPFLTLFSDNDPIMRGADRLFHKLVPGTQGQAHYIVPGGHFLQEDSPEELAVRTIAFIRESISE